MSEIELCQEKGKKDFENILFGCMLAAAAILCFVAFGYFLHVVSFPTWWAR